MDSQDLLLFFIHLSALSLRETISHTDTIINYNGYKVFRVTPHTENQLQILDSLERAKLVQVWKKGGYVFQPWDVMVKPDIVSETANLFSLNGISYEVLIDNVGAIVTANTNETKFKRSVDVDDIPFDRYIRYDTMQDYLRNLAETYPDKISVHTIGASTRGRRLWLAKIFSGSANKPAILIDCGFHAREWMVPMQCIYIIDQLVKNPSNSHMIQNIKWYILPMMNPDGYEYSFIRDRMWRRTRSKGTYCDGVDLNRNFGFHWLEFGSSDNECDEDYAGPYSFSEPEAKALRDFTLNNKNDIKLYISFHSYGELILYPWGYTKKYPRNAKELRILGEAVRDAIFDVRRTKYTVGSSSNTLYVSSGCSDDWMMAVAGIPLTYTIELPGLGYGFQPPASEILGTVMETFEGIKVFHKYIQSKRKYNRRYNRYSRRNS